VKRYAEDTQKSLRVQPFALASLAFLPDRADSIALRSQILCVFLRKFYLVRKSPQFTASKFIRKLYQIMIKILKIFTRKLFFLFWKFSRMISI
jgi:hypothetical protein